MSPNPRYANGEPKTPSRIDRENRQDILKQIVKHNKDHREAPLYIGNPTASTFKELGRIQMRDEGRNKYPIIPPWEGEKNASKKVAKMALALKESTTADRRPHSVLGVKAQPVVKKEDDTKKQSMQNPSQETRNSPGERTSEAPRAVYDAMWANQRATTPAKASQKGKEMDSGKNTIQHPNLKVAESVPRAKQPTLVQKHYTKVAEPKKQQPTQLPAKVAEEKSEPKPIIHTHRPETPVKQKVVAFASTAETNTGSRKPTKSTPRRTPTPLPTTPKPNVATMKAKDAKEKEREEEDEIIRRFNEIQKRRQLAKEREKERRKQDQELELGKQKQN